MTETLHLSVAEPLIRPLVPVAARQQSDALWALVDHLLTIARRGTEPALKQIRLAWWRDALAGLATAVQPADPILVDVQNTLIPALSATQLAGLADALVEAVGADWDADAVMTFGTQLFTLTGHILHSRASGGAAWACVRVAEMIGADARSPLWRAARDTAVEQGPIRSLRALDRLSQSIAGREGERARAREQALVLRVGLIGR